MTTRTVSPTLLAEINAKIDRLTAQGKLPMRYERIGSDDHSRSLRMCILDWFDDPQPWPWPHNYETLGASQ